MSPRAATKRWPLLEPTLAGIEQMSHLISVEFFGDLLLCLTKLTVNRRLPMASRARALASISGILTGQVGASPSTSPSAPTIRGVASQGLCFPRSFMPACSFGNLADESTDRSAVFRPVMIQLRHPGSHVSRLLPVREMQFLRRFPSPAAFRLRRAQHSPWTTTPSTPAYMRRCSMYRCSLLTKRTVATTASCRFQRSTTSPGS